MQAARRKHQSSVARIDTGSRNEEDKIRSRLMVGYDGVVAKLPFGYGTTNVNFDSQEIYDVVKIG